MNKCFTSSNNKNIQHISNNIQLCSYNEILYMLSTSTSLENPCCKEVSSQCWMVSAFVSLLTHCCIPRTRSVVCSVQKIYAYQRNSHTSHVLMIYFMPSPLQFLSHFIIIIIYEACIIIYVLLIK